MPTPKARATNGLNSAPPPRPDALSPSVAAKADADCADSNGARASPPVAAAAMCSSSSLPPAGAASEPATPPPPPPPPQDRSDAGLLLQREKKRKRDGEEPDVALAVRAPRLLSPLDVAGADEIRQHVRDVRREVFSRPLLAVITRLMFHKTNHGLFNVRVDPVAWNIPHYLEVVKRPMDLSLVKSKCLNLEYASADACAADIRLVFANAQLFNPPGHAVHEAARALLQEFEAEFARLDAKAQALAQKRAEHACPSCLANVCAICTQKCINFEPPFVLCSGPCRQRIKRHALYYMTPDQSHHWCGKCYAALPKVLKLPAAGDAAAPAPPDALLAKSALMKAKFLDELTEPWVQCDRCNGWVHQVCALFNACEDGDAGDDNGDDVPFTCPLCRIDELASAEQGWDVEMSPPSTTSVDQFPLKSLPHKHALELMGSHSPVLKRKPTAKEFTRALGFDAVIEEKVFDFLGSFETVATAAAAAPDSVAKKFPIEGFVASQQLRSSALSRFMQAWVRERLEELGERDAAQSIVIKVVSSLKSSCQVSPVVREHFRSERQSYPPSVEFTAKAIFVFQKIDGIEVCIFSMYVQEYDGDSDVVANRHRTYIAYIDSLVYMRPRRVRTRLFHETLIAYLAFCKSRGFHHAHIWACPTTRGGDFIYWCHPSFQKNPGKERLLQWYLQMAAAGKLAGVVFACRDLYASEFEALEARLEDALPPYFDGDYWPAEAERLAASPPKRGKLSREAHDARLKGAHFRKRVVDSVKASRESLFVISLQPTCSVCDAMIVNSSCWKQAVPADSTTAGDVYTCVACYTAAGGQNPAEGPMLEVLPPSFVESWSCHEPDVEIRCPFLDHRPDMLKNCEEQHYQFDSYRRAKYSTMMLIYQISLAQRT